MISERPRIALISATPAAIPPAVGALAAEFPAADVWNLLDDKLLADADEQGGLTDELGARMRRLIDYAVTEGADAVLLTCSMYGAVASASRLQVPVLAPDEAAVDELVDGRYASVLVVASLASALADSVARVEEALSAAGATSSVTGVVAAGAFDATKAGDSRQLAASITEAVRERAADVDVVFLAQYSLAPVGADVAEAVGLPVVSGPRSSAARLHRTLAAD